MYQRGDYVVVEGHRGRRAVLRVWENRGQGLALSTDDGYRRLLAGDSDAPVVGFPIGDVRGRAEGSSPLPTEPEPRSERSQTDAQG